MTEINFKKLSREMSGKSSLGSSLVLFIVLALVICSGIWASYAELDNVTRGDGKIISSMQNQSVQAVEGGVLLRRYVSENSVVKEGELLFEIDPIDASSELNQMSKRSASLEIREQRLRAEISNNSVFKVDQDLRDQTPSVALSEESLFSARKLELLGRVNVLEQRLARSEQDSISGKNTEESTAQTMKLLQEEISIVGPLVKEKIAPTTRLLSLQREFEQTQGEWKRAKVSIRQANLAISEISREIENIKDSYVLEAKKELTDVVSQRVELSEAMPRLKDRVTRTQIRAPTAGVINTINFRTAGGYIRTGDVVLELVPTGEALIVEAKISPKDISTIKVDDEVRIRLLAYDSSKYGYLVGHVKRISADAVVDQRTEAVSHYLVDVSIDSEMLLDGNPVELIPGMTATVDVLTGKRTVFEYLWQPIANVKELALRD
jgi:adhesin transport system membrane fusion protein